MAYTVEFGASADRELRKLSRELQLRLRPRIDALETDPRPPGAKKIAGRENLWRIRVVDYRVVYEIHDRILVVLIVRIAHRREAYR